MCPESDIYTSYLVIHMTDAHGVQSDRKKKKERGAFVSVESFLVPLYFPFSDDLIVCTALLLAALLLLYSRNTLTR